MACAECTRLHAVTAREHRPARPDRSPGPARSSGPGTTAGIPASEPSASRSAGADVEEFLARPPLEHRPPLLPAFVDLHQLLLVSRRRPSCRSRAGPGPEAIRDTWWAASGSGDGRRAGRGLSAGSNSSIIGAILARLRSRKPWCSRSPPAPRQLRPGGRAVVAETLGLDQHGRPYFRRRRRGRPPEVVRSTESVRALARRQCRAQVLLSQLAARHSRSCPPAKSRRASGYHHLRELD